MSRGYRSMWQRGFDTGSGGPVAHSNWRIHVSGARGVPCPTLQAQTANTLENGPGAGQPWLQQLVRELRTRCLPKDHDPADYDPTNSFYVDPNNR